MSKDIIILKSNNDLTGEKNSNSIQNDNNRYINTETIENNRIQNTSNLIKLPTEKLSEEVCNISDNVNLFRKSDNCPDQSKNNKPKGKKSLKEETDIIFNKINQKLKETNKKTVQNIKKSSNSSNVSSPKLVKTYIQKNLNLIFLNRTNNNSNLGKSLKVKSNIISPKSIISGGSPQKRKISLISPTNKQNSFTTERKFSLKSSIDKELSNSIKLEKSLLKNEVISPQSFINFNKR